MSDRGPDYRCVWRRLEQVLGDPQVMPDRRNRWSLRSPNPWSPPIHVMVDDNAYPPAVWVFDPNRPESNVIQIVVEDEPALDRAVQLIQDRVKSAGEIDDRSSSRLPASSRKFLERLRQDCCAALWSDASHLLTLIEQALAGLPRSPPAPLDSARHGR